MTILTVGEQVARDHGLQGQDETEWRALAESCTRVASVTQLQRDYLCRWNEGVGAVVESFWETLCGQAVTVRRKQDIVVDTLRRGKILRPDHFFELDEHFEELQRCGKVSPQEAEVLEGILDRFEADPRNFEWTTSRF